MPLPSGTSISASQVNSYLGKSAGSQVSWNTMIRMLSNNNTSPNMNGIRGQSAFEIQWTTNPSSDWNGTNYTAKRNSTTSAAFLIPGTPWRVILSTNSDNSTNGAYVYDLRIVGTNYGVTYYYKYIASAALPTGYYLGGQPMCVMLDNGKFVIVGGQTLAVTTSNPGFQYGLYFIVLTFNSNGSIASTTHYSSSYYVTNSGYYAYLGYAYNNQRSPNICSKQGNKFVFALSYIVNGTTNYQDFIVTADLSTSTLSLTFDQTGTTLTVNNYSVPKSVPILNSDNTISFFYVYNINSQAYHYNGLLNSTGTAWTNGTRYAASTGYYNITPANGGALYTAAIDTYTTDQPRGYWDSKGNYFWISGLYKYYAQTQIASSPSAYYYSGTVGALSIIKTNATNALQYQIQFTTDGWLYETATSSKSGTVYTWYPTWPFAANAMCAIDTDASGNTYYLYRSFFSGLGAKQGSTAASVDPLTIGAPLCQQNVYNVSKVNSAGNSVVWTVQIDLGAKTMGGMDGYTSAFGDASGYTSQVNNFAWSMIANDTINALEIYCWCPPRNTAQAYWMQYSSNQATVRSICLRMSDGATSTYAVSGNQSLITKYQLTSATTGTNFTMYSNGSATTTTITLKTPQNWSLGARSTSGSTWVTVQAARSSTSVSSNSSTALFSQSPTTNTMGTTFNTSPDSL